MLNKRSDAKFCSPACRAAVKAAEKAETPDLWISSACRYPYQQQAEIADGDRLHRHPAKGRRPDWSGYCVLPDRCGCDTEGCHGVGEFAEPLEPVEAMV